MTDDPRLERILQGRHWQDVRMEAYRCRVNRDRLTAEWCIVCGQSAVEDHRMRFHAAGGFLAGPYCSEWCAWTWLNDKTVCDGEHDPAEIRTERRAEA